MRYTSVDIETTGLDSETCQILSVGAVIEDTNNILPIEELPSIHIVIKREKINGEAFAINMNRELISNIVKFQKAKSEEERVAFCQITKSVYVDEEDVVDTLFRFLWKNGIRFDETKYDWRAKPCHMFTNGETYPKLISGIPKTYLNVAGKNFGTFDKVFLEKLPRWKQVFYVRSRILDPAICYIDWNNDESAPGLDECKKRAGIDGVVTHNAVEDAIDVVKLLRPQYVIPTDSNE